MYHNNEDWKNKHIEQALKWKENNPEKANAINCRAVLKYLNKNRDKINEKNRKRWATDEKYRENKFKSMKKYQEKIKLLIK